MWKARERDYYHRRRAALIAALGGECRRWVESAERGDPWLRRHVCKGELEIHHADGREWEMRRVGSRTRINRLWEEFESGVKLEVTCSGWNRGGSAQTMKKRKRSAGAPLLRG